MNGFIYWLKNFWRRRYLSCNAYGYTYEYINHEGELVFEEFR